MNNNEKMSQGVQVLAERKTMSRREMIKQSGLATLGLLYFTPQVEIIRTVSKSTLNNDELSGFVCASDSCSGSKT